MKNTFLALVRKYLSGSASPAEQQFVEQVYNKLTEEGEPLSEEGHRLLAQVEQNLLNQIRQETETGKLEQMDPAFSEPKRRRWLRPVAAAAILIILGGTAWVVLSEKTTQTPVIAKVADVVAPTSNKARITLADGSTVLLDSLSSLQQNGVALLKTADGKLVYDASAISTTSTEIKYNTLVNPVGSQPISLKLGDGTEVWLNAASSLRYPLAFAPGLKRNVQITGEAYFEVAHDITRPFTVTDQVRGLDVEVLGTHFNVNTYGNENRARVTLLQGSVRLSRNGESSILKPGEQGVVTAGSEPIRVTNGIDLEQVMAWKNGMFKFNNEEIHSIMKQLERWYNVEVTFEGKDRPLNFGGSISRRKNASAVMELLGETEVLKYRIEPSADVAKAGKIVVIL